MADFLAYNPRCASVVVDDLNVTIGARTVLNLRTVCSIEELQSSIDIIYAIIMGVIIVNENVANLFSQDLPFQKDFSLQSTNSKSSENKIKRAIEF